MLNIAGGIALFVFIILPAVGCICAAFVHAGVLIAAQDPMSMVIVEGDAPKAPTAPADPTSLAYRLGQRWAARAK